MDSPYPYRTPDGDIDLEKAVGPHLRHYTDTMESGAGDFRVVSRELLEDSFRELTGPSLRRRSMGLPSRASSSATLARSPEFCWDVCAYYLILGVSWRAAKREIRLAYVAACARPDGQEQQEKLTYIVAQLLDDNIRRAYDRTELGGVFLQDRDVMEGIKRASVREAVRRRLHGEEITADEVMEEAGVIPADEAHEQARAIRQRAAESRWDARWGYYLLDARQADTALLEAWQGMIGAALRERGIVMQFAVGQGPENSPLVLRDIKEPCIFIVTEKGASPQQAIAAIEMGISLGYVKENNTGGI